MSDLTHKIKTTLYELLCRELYVHLMMSHNFLGGQNYNKFGNNVMKRHSSTRQRYVCSTLRWLRRYDELRRNIEMMCIITKNVSLLPWVVCVSGISSCLNNGPWTLYGSIYVVRGTRWWNIMNMIYEQQGCNSQCDVRLMNNTRLRIFCHQMNTFIKTFMLLTERVIEH